MEKILFVCLGNICRSPTAEAVFDKLVSERGLSGKYLCDSAGTARQMFEKPADSRTIAAAKRRKIFIEHKSRQIRQSDFDEFDYIIGMDDSNIRNIEKIRGSHAGKASVLKMAQFLENRKDEVPDPYSGDESDFELVLDLLEVGCVNLLEYLRNRE